VAGDSTSYGLPLVAAVDAQSATGEVATDGVGHDLGRPCAGPPEGPPVLENSVLWASAGEP
jgi:hypothetical protein